MHKSVLLNEIISELDLKPGDIFVDATLGAGGHSRAVCEKFPKAKIIGFDLDEGAYKLAEEKLKGCNTEIFKTNFKNLDSFVKEPFNAMLFDLGLSSMELESSGRGFSFLRNEPLLMTFGDPKEYLFTARDIVNSWDEENIVAILKGYGEEPRAQKIARAIIERRKGKSIETTFDLVETLSSVFPKKGRIHFATKTFQAIRIAVNDELNVIKEVLPKAFHLLKSGGKIFVISFHSLEDRIVKRFFKEQKKNDLAKIITKKPLIATREEILENPRARSAKLRILEKI